MSAAGKQQQQVLLPKPSLCTFVIESTKSGICSHLNLWILSEVPEEEDIWDSPAVGVGVRVAGIAALGALVALIVSIGSPVVTAVLNNRPT